MTRWFLLPCALAATSLMVFCASDPAPTESAPPSNLLIITFDTTRADHLSAYGGTQAQVPNLERLAREGVRFDRAFAPTPLTLPSHVSLFTGLYPAAHGVRENGTYRLEEEALTLADALQAQAFQTAAVIGSQVLSSHYGLDQGFELYDDELPPDRTGEALFIERSAGAVTDRGLSWLRERGDERWFLWLHFFDPHWEYDPPEPHRTRYAASPYDGEIAYADEQAGRVLDFLRDRGWIDRTVIVVTSDHGESLGEHGESTHGLFVYDSTVRVPLLLRHPSRLGTGKQVGAVVRLVDVFPTVLDLLGVPVEGDRIDGESLVALVDGQPDEPRLAWLESWSPRLSFGWSELRAVRGMDWKYIQAPRPELYSLQADPAEEHNLAEELPERATEYRSLLEGLEQTIEPATAPELSSTRQPDAETRRALESLGYVSLGTSGGKGDQPADPKDKVEVFERMRSALELIGQERYSDSVPLLQQLVLDNPDSKYLYSHLGNALLRAGRRADGIRALQRSLQLDPSDFWTLNRLGTAYYQGGDLEEAERTFRRVLTLNPQVGMAYHNLGLIEQQRERPSAAMGFYEQALEHEPDLVRSAINLGALYESAGRDEDALRLYQRVIELDPREEKVFISAAHLLYRNDRHQEALDVLARAQQAHPASPVPALYRAAVYRKLGDTDAVARELRAALAVDPANADARRGLEQLERQRQEDRTP